MQDKSGLIQETNVTNPDHRSTINQRDHLLQATQIIAPNIELLSSQMTKSQATMVNEATCSTATVDAINSNTNTIANTMSTPSNDQTRAQTQHSNNLHTTGTNSPASATASTTASVTTTTTTTTTTPTPVPANATINNSRNAKRTANDYRFGKTIGEGSFSSVYIAQDIHSKKEVASKCSDLSATFNQLSSPHD